MTSSCEICVDEVERHTSSGDCWVVVQNMVIDLSLFMFQHPGGERVLLKVAGKDATVAFARAGHKSILSQRLLRQHRIGTLVPSSSSPSSPSSSSSSPSSSVSIITDMPPPPPPPPPPPAPMLSSQVTATARGVDTKSRRRKVPLGPGYSAMDWMRRRKTIRPPPYRKLALEQVQKHNTVDDCWVVLRGQVYDVTSYLRFHPGGVDELLRGAGSDATALFNEIHAWVNYTFLLQPCLVGSLS